MIFFALLAIFIMSTFVGLGCFLIYFFRYLRIKRQDTISLWDLGAPWLFDDEALETDPTIRAMQQKVRTPIRICQFINLITFFIILIVIVI